MAKREREFIDKADLVLMPIDVTDLPSDRCLLCYLADDVEEITPISEQEIVKPYLDKLKAEIRKLDDINPDYPMDRTIHISRNEVLELISNLLSEQGEKYKKSCENCKHGSMGRLKYNLFCARCVELSEHELSEQGDTE